MLREELILGIQADITDAQANVEILKADLEELEDWDLPELTLGIEADLENAERVVGELETELGEALELPVEVDSTGAEEGLGRVRSSADGAKTAVGQMASNSVSELARVGGAGSAVSQGLGDIARNATQGKLNLAGLAATAGPLLILGFAVQAVRQVLGEIAETKAWRKEQLDSYAAAVDKVGAGVGAIEEHLRSLEDFDFDFGDFGIENVDQLLGSVGVTVDELVESIAGGETGLADFRARLEETGLSAAQVELVMAGVAEQQELAGTAFADSADSVAFYATNQESANRALQEMLDKDEPMQRHAGVWNQLMEDMRDGAIDSEHTAAALNFLAGELNLTTDEVIALAQAELDKELQAAADAAESAAAAAAEYAAVLESTDWAEADLTAATTAMSTYTEGLFAADNQTQALEEAWAALAGTLEDDLAPSFDVTTEAGRAQQDALEGLAAAVDTQLAEAYDKANGDLALFGTLAQGIADDTLIRLQNELGLTADEAGAVLELLGLTPEHIEARFELTGTEEATIKLGLLSGVISNLPPEVQTEVGLLIIGGDPEAALAAIQAELDGNPPVAELEVDTGGAGRHVSAFTGTKRKTTIEADADTDPAAEDLKETTDEERTALIDTDADTLLAAAILTAFITQDRTATINTELPNIGIAHLALELLARTRTSRIDVDANTAAAERAINHTARDRTSTIHVRTSGGGFSSGGGAFAAPAPVAGEGELGPLGAPAPMGAIPMGTHSGSDSPIVIRPAAATNVTIQAAVIGNRFDVQRAVGQALRGRRRIVGSRSL